MTLLLDDMTGASRAEIAPGQRTDHLRRSMGMEVTQVKTPFISGLNYGILSSVRLSSCCSPVLRLLIGCVNMSRSGGGWKRSDSQNHPSSDSVLPSITGFVCAVNHSLGDLARTLRFAVRALHGTDVHFTIILKDGVGNDFRALVFPSRLDIPLSTS